MTRIDIESGLIDLTGKSPLEHLRTELEIYRSMRRRMVGGDDCEFRFIGMEDLVLQHGTVYTPGTLPADHRFHTIMKACFFNCRKAVIRQRSKQQWIYVEGFASAVLKDKRVLPMAHHAWLTHVDTPTIAFDPTWGESDDYAQEEIAYLGIPVRREYVIDIFRRSSTPNDPNYSVFDVRRADYPVLTGKDRVEDIMVSFPEPLRGQQRP